ncbi:MAG: aldo/keto reductase [candidate division KSB1 bacterium]|nr:aldo/keto reductase [candidate division KSB1 bacterium]MDZ7368348.1 aldo/keto reductase [candidate division KSB1 bacterium]MDZ7403068.1 aldo/keto reductase [candidate division KSB1 bacterium]
MNSDFLHASLGSTGIKVHRLGLSATYRPGKKTIYRALDEGLNYFFAFGIDTQMIKALREAQRDKYVLATGVYNYIWRHQNLRLTLEKRLRQFRTDYLDVFLFLGVLKEKEFPDSVREEMHRVREEGKVRAIGISTHNRKFAGTLAAAGALDVIMMRYNAAHRGAEQEIFPRLPQSRPGVISYTATCWTHLMRRPSGWPKNARLPTAGLCYRFVLSNPDVDVCLTAPRNLQQFEENLAAVCRGPLGEVDMEFMRQFGDAVHAQNKWFM